MILEYVDDSGDDGLINSPTRFYVLTTILLYENLWNDTFSRIKEFRKELKRDYGIRLVDELKANYLIRKQGFAHRLNLSEDNRVKIYKRAFEFLSTIKTIRTFSMCIRKKEIKSQSLYIFSYAWKLLLTRQHYTANKFNNEIGRTDKAILISDETNEDKIRKMLRQLRVINYVSGKNIKLDSFIEDPFIRKSDYSYFVQLCDLIAFCVAAKNLSSKTTDPYNFTNLYKLLEPIIEKSVYSRGESEGIVYFPPK